MENLEYWKWRHATAIAFWKNVIGWLILSVVNYLILDWVTPLDCAEAWIMAACVSAIVVYMWPPIMGVTYEPLRDLIKAFVFGIRLDD